jgi:hypothetical protein
VSAHWSFPLLCGQEVKNVTVVSQVDVYNERVKTISAANKATLLDLHSTCAEAIVAVRGIDGKKRPAPTFRPPLFVYYITALILIKMITGSFDKVSISHGGSRVSCVSCDSSLI